MRLSWIIAAVVAIGLITRASGQDDMRQEAEKLIFEYAATFNKQDAAEACRPVLARVNMPPTSCQAGSS